MDRFDWRIWAGIGAGVMLVAGVGYSMWARREPTEDEIEQKRRSHLNQVGRIAEGQILEILDVTPEQAKARGPAFLRRNEKASPQLLVPGRPASVKYDPSNPGDSILIADDWSGLH